MPTLMTMSLAVSLTIEQFARIVRFVRSVWTGTELSAQVASASGKDNGTMPGRNLSAASLYGYVSSSYKCG